MFGVADTRSIDTLEQDLLASHQVHGQVWAGQLETLRRLDLGQVATADGSRTMVEWVASRLDVSHAVARDLMFLARAEDRNIEDLLADCRIGFERAVLMARLRIAGASDREVEDSLGFCCGTAGNYFLTRRHNTPWTMNSLRRCESLRSM